MKKLIFTWLPIFFGCHTRDDRSFHIGNTKFPICSRCTGELIGIFIAIFIFRFIQLEISILILLMLPLIIDGFLQLLTKYNSNNILRLITGILFGYALTTLFFYSVIFVYNLGKDFANTLIFIKNNT